MNTHFTSQALGLGFVVLALATGAVAQSTFTSDDDRFAWSENCGWIDFRGARPNPGDGVRVTSTHLSGYAWSANTGWIHFGDGSPLDAIRYSNTTGIDSGVNHDGAGNLSGLAWSANLGWINFGWASATDTNRPRFDISSGNFSGCAWSGNAGWVNLATDLLRTDSMNVIDTDGDGIADPWERERAGTLPVLTGSGDADGDGISDRQEYILDTNPLVPNSALRITRISRVPGVSAVEVEWPSSPTRVYAVDGKPDFGSTNWFMLGTVPGAAGTNTVVSIERGAPEAFFRVAARLPLQP